MHSNVPRKKSGIRVKILWVINPAALSAVLVAAGLVLLALMIALIALAVAP